MHFVSMFQCGNMVMIDVLLHLQLKNILLRTREGRVWSKIMVVDTKRQQIEWCKWANLIFWLNNFKLLHQKEKEIQWMVVILLKPIISVMGSHCDYSLQAPRNIATPLYPLNFHVGWSFCDKVSSFPSAASFILHLISTLQNKKLLHHVWKLKSSVMWAVPVVKQLQIFWSFLTV